MSKNDSLHLDKDWPLPSEQPVSTAEQQTQRNDDVIPESGQVVAHGNSFFGECFRCVLEVTEDNHFLVQEFSAKQGEKRSNPYILTSKEHLYSSSFDFWQFKEAPIEGEYILWNNQGKKYLQGHFKNGLKHGLWVYWSVDGQKIVEENYIKGQLEGTWKRWSYGAKCQEGKYKNGKKTGLWIQWWFNGQVCVQGHYYAGIPQGEWQWWRRDGVKLVQGLYNKSGQKFGTWLRWNRHGKLTARKNYTNEAKDSIKWLDEKYNITIDWEATQAQNLLFRQRVVLRNLYDQQTTNYSREFLGITSQGYYVVRDYYTLGDEKFTDPYILIDRQAIFEKEFGTWSPAWKIQGTYTQWHANGKKSLTMSFDNGKRHGTQTNWDDAGNKISEKNFNENVLDGFYSVWYPNGQLHEKRFYSHGAREGLWVTWWDNGNKKYQGNYQNDLLYSQWNWWHSNGTDKTQGQYHQGIKYGTWERWDEKRNQIERKNFGEKEKLIASWLRDTYNIHVVTPSNKNTDIETLSVGFRFKIYDIDYLNSYDRVYLGTTAEGYDVIQDFYWEEGDLHRTTPYMIQDKNRSALLYHEVDDVQRCGIEGAYLQWHSTGNIEFKAHMKSGKPTGLWQWWNESKELIKSVNYD